MADGAASNEFVTVHESWGVNEAELVRSMLMANGIKSFFSNSPMTVYPMTVDGMGRVEIKVASVDAERAVELINGHTGDLKP